MMMIDNGAHTGRAVAVVGVVGGVWGGGST